MVDSNREVNLDVEPALASLLSPRSSDRVLRLLPPRPLGVERFRHLCGLQCPLELVKFVWEQFLIAQGGTAYTGLEHIREHGFIRLEAIVVVRVSLEQGRVDFVATARLHQVSCLPSFGSKKCF